MKCSEREEQDQAEAQQANRLRATEEDRAAEEAAEKQAREKRIRTCKEREQAENDARTRKNQRDVEEWLQQHPTEAREIAAQYAGALIVADDLAATPDPPNAPDSYGGRYYLDGEGRFETTQEADSRRLGYLACKWSGNAGCDGPISNRVHADRVEILADMERRKALAKAGFPFPPAFVQCNVDGDFVECQREMRCHSTVPFME